MRKINLPGFLKKLRLAACLWLLVITLGTIFTPVRGQSLEGIFLEEPDTGRYPEISISFRAVDLTGKFVKDLKPAELQITENNRIVTPENLELVQEGIRFYVAVNEGPTLANRVAGVSRFDSIKNTLTAWITSHKGTTPDEFSVFSNQGELLMDATAPLEWATAVEKYSPDLRNLKPALSSFSNAVDQALSGGTLNKKTAAVLFITPLPSSDQFTGLEDIIRRAEQNNIRVFIWLIGPPDYASIDNAFKLMGFSEQTGGAFFLFSGAETLPDLSGWLDPLSYIYNLSYKTPINSSGEFKLALRIQRDNLFLDSNEVTFALEVASPNPIFLSPPTKITRSWTETKRIKDSLLSPDQTTINIMIEFPDGHERDLVYSRLFVDNKLMNEKTSKPFDRFTWDLSGYTETGSHVLQVIIEDSTGLKGETIRIPIEVSVTDSPQNWFQKLTSGINLVKGIIGGIILVLLGGGVVALIRYRRSRMHKPLRRAAEDPVTQPVEIGGEYILSSQKKEEPQKWPTIQGIGSAPARLIRKSSGSPGDGLPEEIALSGDEVRIGSERRKADVLITHLTVSPLHARIFRDTEEKFRVADFGSAAGTWLNYAPVSSHGARLEHGDLVLFGKVAYVFELHGAQPKRIQVLPYTED